MKRARLGDVAQQAGVSLTTASLAMSGKGRISQEVRRRVQAVSRELGYRRRPAGPASGRPFRSIGVLHHVDRSYEWGFIRPFILAIESTLIPQGYVPAIIPVTDGADPGELFERIRGLEVGAVFSIHYSNEELFRRLESSGIMVIILNNSSLQGRFYVVGVDDFQGAYEGAMYLINLGHRNILYVEYDRPENPTVLADRFVGFRKALDERGIPFSAGQRITVDFMDSEELRARLGGSFRGPSGPTAVFAHDDYLAAFIVAALRELGLSVPQDVSLIAPGDVLDYSQPFLPRITTLRINTALMSQLACRLLLDRLSDRSGETHVLKIKQQLIERGSCGRPPAAGRQVQFSP